MDAKKLESVLARIAADQSSPIQFRGESPDGYTYNLPHDPMWRIAIDRDEIIHYNPKVAGKERTFKTDDITVAYKRNGIWFIKLNWWAEDKIWNSADAIEVLIDATRIVPC